MDLAGRHVEIESVDGAHIAETQRNAAQSERLSTRAPAHDIGQRRRTRHDGAVARERTAVTKIKQRRDAARHDQHDQQQQHGVKEGRPRGQGSRDLRQNGEDDGAQHRAQNRTAAADQDRDKEQHRQIERESIRRDVGLQARKQPAGNGRQCTGQQEDRNQHPRLGDAGRFRRHLGVADRDQGATEPAAGDIGAQPGGEGGNSDAECVKAPWRIERCREFRA